MTQNYLNIKTPTLRELNAMDKEAIREKIEELQYMKQLYEEHKKKVLERYKELREKIIHTDNQIRVVCGCFSGSIQEFENEVKKTHGDGKYAKEYMAIINAVKIKFGIV